MSLLKSSFGSTNFGCPEVEGGGAVVDTVWEAEAVEVVEADGNGLSPCEVGTGG